METQKVRTWKLDLELRGESTETKKIYGPQLQPYVRRLGEQILKPGVLG